MALPRSLRTQSHRIGIRRLRSKGGRCVTNSVCMVTRWSQRGEDDLRATVAGPRVGWILLETIPVVAIRYLNLEGVDVH